MRTVIEGGWVIGYDPAAAGHYLLENGSVVINDDRVESVGWQPTGVFDRRIDARGKIVSPGFVNTHVHAGIECFAGLIDVPPGGGSRWIGASVEYLSGDLTDCLPEDQIRTHMEFGLVHMLKSGSTTIVDVIGSSTPWWLGNTPRDVEIFVEIAGRLGARVYSTPGYRSWRSAMNSSGAGTYIKREAEGLRHLERAVAFIEQHHGSHADRIRGMLYPHAVDNCAPELLRATRAAADRLNCGIQIHAAQSVREVQVTLEAYGRTPIELLADTGVLGPDCLLGHCIHINSHSTINRPGDDLGLIADSGTSVAHSPLKFVYSGHVIESFQRYLDRGVNLTIGTDTYPSDVLFEMRVAALAGKLIDHNHAAVQTRDLFNAATLGGARALRRADIGRLAAGAKADLIIVNLDTIDIGPLWDPVRALVHFATSRDIETVMVDGRVVVEDHRVTGVDEPRLMAAAWPIYHRLREVLAERNWNHPTAAEMFPQSLPVRRSPTG